MSNQMSNQIAQGTMVQTSTGKVGMVVHLFTEDWSGVRMAFVRIGREKATKYTVANLRPVPTFATTVDPEDFARDRDVTQWDAEIADDIASAEAYGDWTDGTAETLHDEALIVRDPNGCWDHEDCDGEPCSAPRDVPIFIGWMS